MDTGLIPTLTDAELAKVSALADRIAGIQLGAPKRELVQARLQRRLRARKLPTIAAYLDWLERTGDAAELSDLLDALTTNKTSFFREAEHFDFFAKKVIPGLSAKPRVRVWCAASSTGEEPYTLAMHFAEARARNDVKILASDLSKAVVEQARAGRYVEERLAGIPAELRARYFDRARDAADPTYVVKPTIRSLVRFARINLMDPWPLRGPLDSIWCRNCMIYFDAETRRQLVRRFHDLLAPGGYLFIGLGESLTGIPNPYRYVRPGVYQRC